MIKQKIYIWACDYSNITGEGNLGRIFVKDLSSSFKTTIIEPNNILIVRFFNFKYLSPFLGIIFCWIQFLSRRNCCYLNYLPLWNFIIFLLLPPNTILGPITGGSKFPYGEKINFVRSLLFPTFYKISEFCLKLRNVKIFFSTDLLKDKLGSKLKKKSKFNYVLKLIKIKKKNVKKNIDFLIYYRKHKNKENYFPFEFLKKLIKKKYKIHIVGDILNLKGVRNYGYVSNYKLNQLLSKSNYTLGPGENVYTIFIIECINNNVNILLDKNYNHKIKYYKKNFLIIDYKKNYKFNKIRKV